MDKSKFLDHRFIDTCFFKIILSESNFKSIICISIIALFQINTILDQLLSNYESRFEVFKKYFRKLTLQITGDYVNDDFKFIDSLKDEEDCEKPVQRTSRDSRHEKFRNQANSFENYDFLKDFKKKSNKIVKN